MHLMKNQGFTVGFISLGCPKNIVDSERMLAEIAKAGLLIAAEPDGADVVVINTCGFISPAKAEALEVIKEAASWKAKGAVKKVVVAGCLPERDGETYSMKLTASTLLLVWGTATK
jgi:ribosomal protein S12 methylthiotransferase